MAACFRTCFFLSLRSAINGSTLLLSRSVPRPSTSLIFLHDLFHSFALPVSFGYPGFLSAGTVLTIFKVDRTASQINSRNWSNRNARISMVRGPGFTGENRIQSTAIQRFLSRNEMMAKR